MVSIYKPSRKMSLATLLSQNDVPSASHHVPNEALAHPRKGSLAYIVHDWPSATSLCQGNATNPSTSKHRLEMMDHRQVTAGNEAVMMRHRSSTGDSAGESQPKKDLGPPPSLVDPSQTKKRKRTEESEDNIPSKRPAGSRWDTGLGFMRNLRPVCHRVPEQRDTNDEGDKAGKKRRSVPVTATVDSTSKADNSKVPRGAQESEVPLRRSARIKSLQTRKKQDNGVAK